MKKRLFDVWTGITLALAAGYALFLLYPLGTLLFKSVFNEETHKL